MPAPWPETFERDTAGTETEWLSRLPGACRDHALSLGPAGEAIVTLGSGRLHLSWSALPDRRIALLRTSRLAVRYRFVAVDEAQRAAFMKYFDLYMQRGGG